MSEKTNQELLELLERKEITYDEYEIQLEEKRRRNREKQRRRKERMDEQRKATDHMLVRREERYSTTLYASLKTRIADYAKTMGTSQGIIIERTVIEYMSRNWSGEEDYLVFYRPLPREAPLPSPVTLNRGPENMPKIIKG